MSLVESLCQIVAESFDSMLAGPVVSTSLLQYLILFCTFPEADSDATSGNYVAKMVHVNAMKFVYLALHLSWDIRLKVVVCGILYRYDFRPEVASDVIYGTAIENVGLDVHVKNRLFLVKPFSRYSSSSLRSNDADDEQRPNYRRLQCCNGRSLARSSKIVLQRNCIVLY